MARIFLTGATGYVGGDVLHLLQTSHPEYQINTLVRGSENTAIVSKAYPKVRVVTGDLDNASLIEEEARLADVVIHAAANKHLPSVEAISRGLANRTKPAHWIQISGASVLSIADIERNRYGEPAEKSYDDVKDVNELRDIIHKNSTARAVDEYLLGVTGTKTAIVFPPIIYGKGNGPVSQRSYQIPNLSKVAIETRQTVQVNKGESTWSNIHVADLSRIFVKLVEKAVEGADDELWNQNGLYLVGNAEAITFGQISQQVANAAHKLGLTDNTSIKTVTAAEADQLMGKGSVFWGTNAHQFSSRVLKLLGWTQQEHSLEKEIPLTVQDEASRLKGGL